MQDTAAPKTMLSNCYAIAALVFSFTLCCSAQSTSAEGWALVFSDDFDKGALDRTKWATRYIYSNEKLDHLNDEKQIYRDNDNHIVKDGRLEIVARNPEGDLIESGLIRSIQTFYYGYFEARVFLPRGNGIWPAFWLNSDYNVDGELSWPPEIDIFEYVVNGAEDTSDMVHSTAVDYPRGSPIKYTYLDPNYSVKIKSYIGGSPLNDDWRVFGLVWTPTEFTVFLDGKRLYSRLYEWKNRSGLLAPPAHVLINFAIGGKWAGRHGIDADFPKTLLIDYVRVCQISRHGEGQRNCGGGKYTPDPVQFGYKSLINDLAKPSIGCAASNNCNLTVGVGTQFQLSTQIDVSEEIPKPRLLSTFITGETGETYLIARKEYPELKEAHLAVEQTLSLPAKLPKGAYSIIQSLSTIQTDQRHSPGRQTPIECAGVSDGRKKALQCRVGTLFITDE